jgi:hypothetical protein
MAFVRAKQALRNEGIAWKEHCASGPPMAPIQICVDSRQMKIFAQCSDAPEGYTLDAVVRQSPADSICSAIDNQYGGDICRGS